MNYKQLDDKMKVKFDFFLEQGHSMRSCARLLNISHSTVSWYKNNAYKKRVIDIQKKYSDFIEYLLEELIEKFRECDIVEMSNFASTQNKWKMEIVNSLWIYSELNYRTVSNAIIENRNKIIKNVKHNSNGYHNWNRFRNRLMYILDSDAGHRIIPNPLMVEMKSQLNWGISPNFNWLQFSCDPQLI